MSLFVPFRRATLLIPTGAAHDPELADVSPSREAAVLVKLTANWRGLVESEALPLFSGG